jgi:hypothetical protein
MCDHTKAQLTKYEFAIALYKKKLPISPDLKANEQKFSVLLSMVIPWNIHIFQTAKLPKWPTKIIWPAFIIYHHKLEGLGGKKKVP